MITKFSKGVLYNRSVNTGNFNLDTCPTKKQQHKFKNESTGGIAFEHQARVLTWKLM